MAASYLRAAEDELSCPICFELFVDPNTPKTLPACGHVCCEVCLKKMATGMCDRKCPECRNIVSIPREGVTSFLTNFRLRSLADMYLGKIADGQSLSGGQTVKPTGNMCRIHDGEKMRYYCTTCNVLACHVCMTMKHKDIGHNVDGLTEKYSRQIIQLRSFIEKADCDIKLAKDTKQKLETQVELERQSGAEAENQIDDCVEAYMNRVREQSQSLKFKLRQASEKKMAALQQKIAAVDEEIQSAESSHIDAANALENKPDYEYVTQHTSLVDKMNRLRLKECVSRINTTLSAGTRFVQSIASDITLGHVVVVRELESIQTLDGFELATNTAGSADGLLLAVCDFRGKNVITYRRAANGQYEKSRILNLRSSNQTRPKDVAICSDGRFLVATAAMIDVYTPEGRYLKNIITTDGQYGSALNLCPVTTMSNGRILVGDVARSVITEHYPTGNIVRTIATKIPPAYITLIHDTHLAMSNYQSGKVSVMDFQSGQETLRIDIPEVKGICYDEQTDCLLAVRGERDSSDRIPLNTGVIEQYCCNTGRLVACLATGLYHPQGIGFLSDGILTVANWKTVEVYKIQ